MDARIKAFKAEQVITLRVELKKAMQFIRAVEQIKKNVKPLANALIALEGEGERTAITRRIESTFGERIIGTSWLYDGAADGISRALDLLNNYYDEQGNPINREQF